MYILFYKKKRYKRLKKLVFTLLLTALLVASTIGGISAFAYVSLEDCDRCFRAAASAMLDGDDVEGSYISAVRKPVYDVNLQHLGYAYEFTVASGDGYAIVICDENGYTAREFYPSSASPYAQVGKDELCVYINNMSYYKAYESEIYDIASGEKLSEQAVEILKKDAVYYQGSKAVTPEYTTVTIEFKYRDYDGYDMCWYFPHYNGNNLRGGCAAVAGGNIVGYFDRYYENLIPNHSAGYEIDGHYVYNLVDSAVYSAIDKLYADMKGTANGISEANFKSGINKYCSRLGYTCELNSIMSSGKLNYMSVMSNMKANKPVVMFLSTYNTCHITTTDNEDIYDYDNYSGNHVMVGFAYRDIFYTLKDGSLLNMRMIEVATGFGDPSSAYFNIDYSTNVDAAYGAYIH